MKNALILVLCLTGVILLALLVLGLVILINSEDALLLGGNPYPPPTNPTIPTTPPMPTLLPTPWITPLPMAAFPIVPLPQMETPKPYKIVFRDGNNLYAIEEGDSSSRLMLDVSAKTSLFLTDEKWGEPSPDGSRLALALTTSPGPGEKGKPIPKYSIYVFDLATGGLSHLVADGVNPTWSPDGRRIAYRGPNSGLWIVDVHTGEQWEAYPVDHKNEHSVDDIHWSPDGGQLVFIDRVFRQSDTLMIVSADKDEPAHKLVVPWDKGFFSYSPQWSPDGKWITVVSMAGESSSSEYFYNLWIVGSDGTNPTQLTRDMQIVNYRWAPDGKWIAFAGWRAYESDLAFYDLWLIDWATTKLERLTFNAPAQANASMVNWSPDGAHLFFIKNQQEVWDVSLIDGSQIRLDAVTPDFIIVPPSLLQP